jgi:enterochelin esterase-like enzyme
MAAETSLTSPKLEILRRQVEAGDADAQNRFWREIGEQGTPVIEAIPGDDRHSLVTFVWRAEEGSQNVAVVSNLSGGLGASAALARLPGTDLWHKTYKLPNDTRESYQFAVAGSNLTDPFNPRRYVFSSDPEIGLTGWESSVIELPAAPLHRWSALRPGVAQGQVTRHRFRSDVLDNEYSVWVYTPPAYATDGAPYGWLMVFDGWFYINLIPTPTILDNLLADGRIPPLVAIMVGHPFDKYRRRDLACYPPFEDFVVREMVPWARQTYHLADDPAQTAVVGGSLGGMMAAYMGLRHAGIFGNVLAQSAYFGWKRREDDEDEWIVRQYVAGPKLPLRFSITAGLFETDIPTPLPGFKNLLVSARHARDVLLAKGYPVRYSEYSGGHNPICWRGPLAEGLQALFGQPEPAKGP